MLSFEQMDPQDTPDQLQFLQQQINQGLLEHQIVVQALRAQCLVSFVFVLVLSLLSFWMWRRSVCCAEALVAQAKRHYSEQSERERRHSRELIELQRQHGMEQVSTARTTLREFAEALQPRQGG